MAITIDINNPDLQLTQDRYPYKGPEKQFDHLSNFFCPSREFVTENITIIFPSVKLSDKPEEEQERIIREAQKFMSSELYGFFALYEYQHDSVTVNPTSKIFLEKMSKGLLQSFEEKLDALGQLLSEFMSFLNKHHHYKYICPWGSIEKLHDDTIRITRVH